MELIMEALEKNAKFFPNEVALVEINPAARPAAEMTWREYTLIETSAEGRYRRDMTWRVREPPLDPEREEGRQGGDPAHERP